MVLGPFLHVEKKIDKPAQIQALDGMKETFPVNILGVVQKVELVCSHISNQTITHHFWTPDNSSVKMFSI